MEYNQFKQLLALKGIREKETVSLLGDFIEKFPYCQTSRLLYAKALHDQSNIHYDQHLKLAAAYAPNREVLRELIDMKTEEVEFEFPLSKKEEHVQEVASGGKEEVSSPDKKPGNDFEEWYSADEISGQAFEEQKKKEIPVDPHAVIKQRLSEILGTPQPRVESVIQEAKQKEEEPSAKAIADIVQQDVIVPAEIKIEQIAPSKTDPEETVYQEDILAEKKLEEELLHPAPEKSPEEKVIIEQAGKDMDILDRMELEHAMEESILDSLEKLPVIAPIPSQKQKEESGHPNVPKKAGSPDGQSKEQATTAPGTPRSFTEWLKATNTVSNAGFEEVRAPKNKAENIERTFPSSDDEQDSLLSDDELIEKFLLEDPKIVPSRAEFYSPVSQAKKSVMDHDDVVSETLAQIYRKQGNFVKARWCYEKLILLYPEKSAFFAALLKEIPEGE